MREILFRGFHPCDGPETIVVDGEKVKGEWVEGWYCMSVFGRWPLKDTIIPDQEARDGCVEHIEVLPSTVGQYTGLTDSVGRKVFEGDILKFKDEPNEYEWTGCIEFGNPNCGYTWGFQVVHLSGPEPNIDTLCWFDMEEGGAYSEVIGTVFDEEKSHEN